MPETMDSSPGTKQLGIKNKINPTGKSSDMAMIPYVNKFRLASHIKDSCMKPSETKADGAIAETIDPTWFCPDKQPGAHVMCLRCPGGGGPGAVVSLTKTPAAGNSAYHREA